MKQTKQQRIEELEARVAELEAAAKKSVSLDELVAIRADQQLTYSAVGGVLQLLDSFIGELQKDDDG